MVTPDFRDLFAALNVVGLGYTEPMGRLSTDLDSPGARPYFLCNEDLTVAELRRQLAGGDESERLRLLAVLLREARDLDVWAFVTPQEVARALPRLLGVPDRRVAS